MIRHDAIDDDDLPRRERGVLLMSSNVAGSKTVLRGLRRFDDRLLPVAAAVVAEEPVQRRAAQKLMRVLRRTIVYCYNFFYYGGAGSSNAEARMHFQHVPVISDRSYEGAAAPFSQENKEESHRDVGTLAYTVVTEAASLSVPFITN